MNMSTPALEAVAICLGLIVIVALGSQEAAAHHRLILGGALIALMGFCVIGLSGPKARRGEAE
jgi:hypothetical protein